MAASAAAAAHPSFLPALREFPIRESCPGVPAVDSLSMNATDQRTSNFSFGRRGDGRGQEMEKRSKVHNNDNSSSHNNDHTTIVKIYFPRWAWIPLYLSPLRYFRLDSILIFTSIATHCFNWNQRGLLNNRESLLFCFLYDDL